MRRLDPVKEAILIVIYDKGDEYYATAEDIQDKTDIRRYTIMRNRRELAKLGYMHLSYGIDLSSLSGHLHGSGYVLHRKAEEYARKFRKVALTDNPYLQKRDYS